MRNYKPNELAILAKRDNNTKRPYLLVDPLQGKHLPVSPNKACLLFEDLATKLYEKYPTEKLFIIGFAETATAIGAAIACASPVDTYYIHTTRECIENAEYIYFSETHSHATEQKLISNQLVDMIEATDRIIFAEDEVTTGNTILNIINILKEKYSNLSLKFGIVSILNNMTEETIERFEKDDISCVYMVKLPDSDYLSLLSNYNFETSPLYKQNSDQTTATTSINSKVDPRIGVKMSMYLQGCESLTKQIMDQLEPKALEGKKILVLGTEEFMFPALYFAKKLESDFSCASVRFHATTRSPILPCSDENYPIFSRYELKSFYEEARTTFIYNLSSYDYVYIIHDSNADTTQAQNTLVTSLLIAGCNNINIYRWE